MTHQLLDRPDVVTVLEKVCGERMTECVAGAMFLDAGQRHCFFDGALKDGFVQMVPASNSGFWIQIVPMRGKYPLPSPCVVCIRVLSAKRFRQSNVAATFLQIFSELNVNILEVQFEAGLDGGGKNRDAILVPFPLPHGRPSRNMRLRSAR